MMKTTGIGIVWCGAVVVAVALVVGAAWAAEPGSPQGTVGPAAAPAIAASAEAPTTQPVGSVRQVDLVICLDTSNSMDGLIDSAKQKLWAVVNEIATAKPVPKLRVALYQYGNDGLNSENGWVERVCELTDDLDTVYGKLFALKTNGGTEYVARVVRAATEELKWSEDPATVRILFVAGNEPATQDPAHKLQDICKAAATKGIVVNTIFCGGADEGRQTGWSDAAAWADGTYAAIDQDRGTVVVATPYDKKLVELGAELNKTYVGYGQRGREGKANQAAQDDNASSLGAPAAAERASAKSTKLYDNDAWDLVDAEAAGKVKVEEMKDEDLPEEMREMTPEQRKEHVEQLAAQRAELQKQIQGLSQQRDAHVKAEMEKQGLDEGQAFDQALREAVRQQLNAPQAPQPEKAPEGK